MNFSINESKIVVWFMVISVLVYIFNLYKNNLISMFILKCHLFKEKCELGWHGPLIAIWSLDTQYPFVNKLSCGGYPGHSGFNFVIPTEQPCILFTLSNIFIIWTTARSLSCSSHMMCVSMHSILQKTSQSQSSNTHLYHPYLLKLQ